jgi:cobalt/nickel transport system permease protein
MTLAFDEIPAVDSCLTRLDPRWKLAALTAAVASAAALRTLPASAVACAGALALAALGRLPMRWWAQRLGAVALMLAPFVLFLPFLYSAGGPGWSLGFLRVSPEGIRLAVLLVLKAVTISTLVLVLLATAPLMTTLKAAHVLRVPGLLIHLLALTYRYVFVVLDELARLRIALRVRGFRNRASLASYRTIGHVTGTLLVRSFERAERVGQAMRCRGFAGRFRSLAEFHTRPADVLAWALITAGAAALAAWDFGGTAGPWPTP